MEALTVLSVVVFSVVSIPCTTGHIAFSARLSSDLDFQANEVIVFDEVLTNEGQAYITETGIFMAPYAGLYGFSFSLSTRDWSVIELVKNNVVVTQAEADTLNEEGRRERSTASYTIMLMLDTYDQVHLRQVRGSDKNGMSGKLTTFTGWSIQ